MQQQQQQQQPHLVTISGPMFCGKTTELLRRVRRTQFGPRPPRCLVIKYAKDTRYDQSLGASSGGSTFVTTHDHARLPAVTAGTLDELRAALAEYQPGVLALDEGQFFPGLARWLLDDVLPAADTNGLRLVVVAGLNLNYRGELWPEMRELCMHADEHMALAAVCRRCGSEWARYSHRTAVGAADELIGGAESYEALCRACFYRARPAVAASEEGQAQGVGCKD